VVPVVTFPVVPNIINLLFPWLVPVVAFPVVPAPVVNLTPVVPMLVRKNKTS
jgi:hypothetical protein